MANITKEELQDILSLRDSLGKLVSESGQTSLQIQLLESEIVELKNKLLEQTASFKVLLNEEQKLVNRLSGTYGTGVINYDTGEFITEK